MTWNISLSSLSTILIFILFIRINIRAGLVFAIDNLRYFNEVNDNNPDGASDTRKPNNNKVFKRVDDGSASVNSSGDDMTSNDDLSIFVREYGKSDRKVKSPRTDPLLNSQPIDMCPVSPCSKPPCQLIQCNSTAPFCIVDVNGFHCDNTDQNVWRINNQDGLVFSDLKFEGQQCQTFIPPKNQVDADFLVQLIVNSSFGSQFLSNITGTWTNPFDFLGNCKNSFFCDTSVNGGVTTTSEKITNGICRLKFSRVTPCFSANQCDTHRCTGDFINSNGTTVKNNTVLTSNGQPILTDQICAALNDLQRPILTFQPPDVPATNATSTPEIILLSIVITAAVLIIFITIVRIRKYARERIINIFSNNKNDPSRQRGFKNSDDDIGSISSNVASALLPPLPVVKRSSFNSNISNNSDEFYNDNNGNGNVIGVDSNFYNINRTSHVSSISDFSGPRGSNFGSIGIINMTNVGIGRNNISIQNPFETVKLARVQSQTAKIFDPESYLQQNQNEFGFEQQNLVPEQNQNEFVPEQQNLVPEQNQNEFVPEQQNQNEFIPEQQDQNEFVPEQNQNEFILEQNQNEFIPEQNQNEFIPEQNQNEFIPEQNQNEFVSEPKDLIIEKSEEEEKNKNGQWIEDEITRENALNATLELEDMVIVSNPKDEIEEERLRQERRQKKLEMLWRRQFKGNNIQE
ncbi:28749_t:CDS:2 [Dentiscutata erythropus]|uniref:28749_t:CDS:1 n=1 Tax=Dentiscutata erythropus TaxID=1348616 RepID=A0A9N8ZKS3_9GLOM|nr:28749_t:CDS:2 [Dentiscutata erythropus]